MKIVMASAPEGFLEAAFARMYQEDARSGTVPASTVERRITGWHRAYVPQPEGKGQDFGLAFAGWRCLAFANNAILARYAFAWDSEAAKPQVTGVATGAAVSRWVAALSRTHNCEQLAGDYEPALLLVPDAIASGLLLLPKEPGSPPFVWSLIRRAQSCKAGLQTLEKYRQDCASVSAAWTKRAHA